MKISILRVVLSAICMASVLAAFTNLSAGPVQFDQVIQVVNARPGDAETGSFSRLLLADEYTFLVDKDDDDKNKRQDGRVITETKSEIVEVLKERMNNDRDQELATGLRAVVDIARARLGA